MLNKIDLFFDKNSYVIFLFTLIFWIGFLPLLEITGMIQLFEFIIVIFIILSAFYFFFKSNKKLLYLFYIPIVTLIHFLDFFFNDNELLNQAHRFILLFLLFFITIHLLQKLFKEKNVDVEVIAISIAAYVMISIMSSILCWFTYNLYPGSYNITLNEYGAIVDFIYYSMVTMSTLGYGDILPTSPQSKSLAIVITLVGQFYMAILVAFLVGKFLSQRK